MTIEKLKNMAHDEEVSIAGLAEDSLARRCSVDLIEAFALAIEALEMRDKPSAVEQLAALGGEPKVWLSVANGEFVTFCIRAGVIHFGHAATVEAAMRQAREATA